MLSLIRRIHRAVIGSESWYAAWQAIKSELRGRWPDSLPTLGSAILAMWTWLTGSALPWAVLAGVVAFVMIYVARVANEFRHGRPRAATQADPDQAIESIERIKTIDDEKLKKLLHGIQSGLYELLDYSAYNVRYQLLLLLHQETPKNLASHFNKDDITDEWVLDQTRMALDYVDHVKVTLYGTDLDDAVLSAMEMGKSEAEAHISSMRDDERPLQIHPYKFLQYGVARFQYEQVINVLRGTIRADEKNLKAYLHNLRHRLHERNTEGPIG